jgi:hypothetical protein
MDPADTDGHVRWTRELWGAVEPLTTGNAYINHIAGDDRPERIRSSYGSNYNRLVAVKNTYDPQNVFRLNANVKPTVMRSVPWCRDMIGPLWSGGADLRSRSASTRVRQPIYNVRVSRARKWRVT